MKTPACLSFTCPSCGTPYEIFLKSQPDLMIVNCSACKTCVSLYDGQVSAADQELLTKIKTAETDIDITSIFNYLQKKNYKDLISKDDVVNLQIDLAQCETFDDVLKLVCQK
jgi:hypothetical protein